MEWKLLIFSQKVGIMLQSELPGTDFWLLVPHYSTMIQKKTQIHSKSPIPGFQTLHVNKFPFHLKKK